MMGADDSLLKAAASRRLYLLDYAGWAAGAVGSSGQTVPGRASPMRQSPCSPLARIGEYIAGGHPVRTGPATHPMFVRPPSRRVICAGVGRWPRRWSRSPRRTTTRCSST